MQQLDDTIHKENLELTKEIFSLLESIRNEVKENRELLRGVLDELS